MEEGLKSPIHLLRSVLREMEHQCCVSTALDLKTIESRVKAEGFSFLAITLANFGSDFQKSLDLGYVADDLFAGFRRRGGLPVFLRGFLQLVFDPEGGRLLDEPSVAAIQCVRQITLMWAKVKLPTTDSRNRKAIDKYMECEQDVRSHDVSFGLNLKDEFQSMSTRLWSGVLTRVDHLVYSEALQPKHGPGTTADGLLGNSKWTNTEWPLRLDLELPAWRYQFSNLSEFSTEGDRIVYLEPGEERPVEVILVPKTLKTPRVIAREPTVMQYMQQAIMAALVEQFELPRIDGMTNFAYHFIEFSSQSHNQDMARKGSSDGSLATLDLSEASDRVSNQHVRTLLSNHPWLARAVEACRSRKADVPGYGVVRLAKFASMGSALTFPLEAMVFCTVVFLGIQKKLNRHLTHKDIKSFVGRVRVYGDDIIVPTEYAESVVDTLESFGFKVNRNKSFWNGKFRESCGKEYYAGTDVSIVKLREMLPAQRRDTGETISLVAFRNLCYQHGYWRLVKDLDERLESLLGDFPAVHSTSPGMGKLTYLPYQTDRMHADFQSPVVRGWMVVPTKTRSELDGYGALLKFFVTRRDLPSRDEKHLLYAGRPAAVNIKRRWFSPF
jgi:hypothetical protein